MNGMFTDRVKKVMQLAREESVRLGNDYVGTEHLLLGLIREGEGVAVVVLKNLGVELEELGKNIENCRHHFYIYSVTNNVLHLQNPNFRIRTGRD